MGEGGKGSEVTAGNGSLSIVKSYFPLMMKAASNEIQEGFNLMIYTVEKRLRILKLLNAHSIIPLQFSSPVFHSRKKFQQNKFPE